VLLGALNVADDQDWNTVLVAVIAVGVMALGAGLLQAASRTAKVKRADLEEVGA
jgi:hypothetical protein